VHNGQPRQAGDEPVRFERMRRSLASELRSLRLTASVTQPVLAERTELSQPKISKIERGKISPSIRDVERLLDGLGVSGERREELVGWARSLATEFHGIRDLYRKGVDWSQERVKELELSATSIRNFESVLIPGFLQTPQYMRDMIGLTGRPAEEVAAAVSVRVERQQLLLYDESKTLEILVHEAALWTRYGSGRDMRAQLEHLIWMLEGAPNLMIGVVPFSAKLNETPLYGFGLLDDRIVLLELLHGWQGLTDPDDVEPYATAFALLRDKAKFGDEARLVISRALDSFQGTPT
jgi:transcriptional regulator with XRE-family HTH domain